MKEIIRLLKKDKKDFISFDILNGSVFVNYYENSKLHSVIISDNQELNIHTIRAISEYLHKILNITKKHEISQIFAAQNFIISQQNAIKKCSHEWVESAAGFTKCYHCGKYDS